MACATISPASSTSLPEPPKAFLIVTAHWEADKPTVSVNPKPGMLYDYYGFPEHTYELKYPAPGEPALAAEVKRLIEAAGLPVATDGERGFDHGMFVPLLIVDPKARDPGRDALAAQGPRSCVAHHARQGARAFARRGRRDRRQRHELP